MYLIMVLILIPILIVAAIVGVYEREFILSNLNLSVPQIGEEGLDIRQFLSAPGGTSPDSDSPIHQLGK